MIHSPNRFCPRVPYAQQDSGRVQYWVIWSLGQRNKFISHPTTAIRQLTFGPIATLFWNQTTSHFPAFPNITPLAVFAAARPFPLVNASVIDARSLLEWVL